VGFAAGAGAGVGVGVGVGFSGAGAATGAGFTLAEALGVVSARELGAFEGVLAGILKL